MIVLPFSGTGFGTIRNNTALKLLTSNTVITTGFWNHSKQHSSKTAPTIGVIATGFWNHSKQHSSKTWSWCRHYSRGFWNHSKQHSSKTKLGWKNLFNSSFGTIRNNTALKPRRLSFFYQIS